MIFYTFLTIILSISFILIIFESFNIQIIVLILLFIIILTFTYVCIILSSLIYYLKHQIEESPSRDVENIQNSKNSDENTWATEESWLSDATNDENCLQLENDENLGENSKDGKSLTTRL